MIHVTQNAIDHYIAEIEPVDREQARAAIAEAEAGVDAAVRFGAHIVKTAKAKLVLQGHRVVDVLPRHWIDNRDLSNAERAQRFAECAAAWS